MKNEGVTILVSITFLVIVAAIGSIVTTHHPYLSAAFVAVCWAVYCMSGRE